MNISQIRIKGFRRFEDAAVDLEGDVIAIVGPNEAGKSSLLKALVLTESHDPFESNDFTRNAVSSQEIGIITRFILRKEDQDYAATLGGLGKPRWYVVEKESSGKLIHWLEPKITRNIRYRETAVSRIAAQLSNKRWSDLFASHEWLNEQEGEGEQRSQNLLDILNEIMAGLDLKKQDLEPEIFEQIERALECFGDLQIKVPKKMKRSLEINEEIFRKLLQDEEQEHPQSMFLDYCDKLKPDILLFDDADRQLSGEYPTTSIEEPPAALKNLLELAEINNLELKDAIDRSDFGKRERIEENANEVLKDKFNQAWKQSPVFVRLQIDQDVIRILVNATDSYSPIAERSDGLRAFVAMFAYSTLKGKKAPHILLIDEAETHLHYDAQADLVRVFEEQETASQIIFTTHSAGCLPNDLGTGIRVVRPLLDDEGNDSGKSEITSSFWGEGAGFSPLMMAMGASIMAMIPTRHAVIAEGGSDVILLPTLFRQSIKQERLGFQVAPGLASISADKAKELNLEAPAVAYIMDGDDAGKEIKRKLIRAGIQQDLIVSLPNKYVVEDLVEIDVYVKAINEELRRSHGELYEICKDDLSDFNRPRALSVWCNDKGIDEPNKVRIAKLIASYRADQEIISPKHKKMMADLHIKLKNIVVSTSH